MIDPNDKSHEELIMNRSDLKIENVDPKKKRIL
jgi:hypothetical protein